MTEKLYLTKECPLENNDNTIQYDACLACRMEMTRLSYVLYFFNKITQFSNDDDDDDDDDETVFFSTF